jgi:hypothetical protein
MIMVTSLKQITRALIVVLIFSAGTLHAQEGNEGTAEENRHMVGALIGHALVFKGFRGGESRSIYVPSFAVQYNYELAPKWALGFHVDALIETFVIEDPDGIELERERPVATILVGAYEIAERLGLILGGGVEWEKNENFPMARFGVEYGVPIGNNGFEFISTLNGDILFGGYSTLNLGLGVAKTF